MPIFSIRPDAHDWLVGQTGSARRALKAIRVCVEAGLEVHVDCTPTRPSMGFLKETVGVLGRLGVSTMRFRRPRLEWMSSDDHVALSPRLGLLEPELRDAQNAAERLGMTVRWVGFSACSVTGLRGQRWHSDRWIDVHGTPLVPLIPSPTCGCADTCIGLPGDYIQRFGWHEFQQGPSTRVREMSRRAMNPQETLKEDRNTGVFVWFSGDHRTVWTHCSMMLWRSNRPEQSEDGWLRPLKRAHRLWRYAILV